ncbi:MAG: YdcH family protein [Vicinamibacterales bacterium]
MKDSQDLRNLLLQTDEEFRQLASRHQELEERLQDLSTKSYLSQPEQVEQTTLKKRKLQLKDRMEDILRRYQRGSTSSLPGPHPTPANG